MAAGVERTTVEEVSFLRLTVIPVFFIDAIVLSKHFSIVVLVP